MAINPHLIIFVTAAGLLAFAVWRSRREGFETPEQRQIRKAQEAMRKRSFPTHQTDQEREAYYTALGREPEGYAQRLARKMGLATPRDEAAEYRRGLEIASGRVDRT